MKTPRVIRVLAVGYLVILVVVPIVLVFQKALASGVGAWWRALQDPDTASAIWFTAKMAALVVPCNVLFGLGASLLIVRRPSWFTKVLDTVIDVPLAISPVIIGLMLELTYAQSGWFGNTLARWGLQIIFSWPGVALASAAVSLPLVSREVIPLLRDAGTNAQQTAATLGASPARILFTITLPSIRWGLAYGVTLTLARVLGEYGAVLIVSGNIASVTQTLTLNIAENFDNFASQQGFAGALLLAMAALVLLVVLSVAHHRERNTHEHFAALT